jgi:Holliday junction resolvase RusA-like endonuclease
VDHFGIDGEPFAWKRTTQDQAGRRINPRAMRLDQQAIAAAAGKVFIGRPPHFGPVKLFVLGVFDIPASWSSAEQAAARSCERYRDIDPDADRLLNQVMDGLKFVAYVDDCQVADCRCVMRYGTVARRQVWLEELPAGNRAAAQRRQRKWRGGGYNRDIAKAPCGQARWPLVINADAHRLGLELVR